MSSQFYTVRTFAQLLGVDEKTVRREITRGRLPAVHIGRAIRIEPAEAQKYLRKCRQET